MPKKKTPMTQINATTGPNKKVWFTEVKAHGFKMVAIVNKKLQNMLNHII